jgi:endonuclease/exonuclease/phosphatase family metal-dependent hydrolase
MANITDVPSQSILDEIDALNSNLDNFVPPKKANNLLIATWNLRAFGDLTEEWIAGENDSPKRDLQSLLSIITIIKRFDIVAVQEVKDNLKCLRDTMHVLGSNWSFIMTDVTKGDKGNGERLAFIFNNQKVKLSGLACEIVIPDEQLKNNIAPDALDSQFARTPYAVSFMAKDKTFVLLTLHVLYGDNSQSRVPELKAIAQWMYDWAKDLKRWGHSLITLGDFNIERKDDVAYQAFMSTGLYVPDDLKDKSRSLFDEVKLYDQIAWFRDSQHQPKITLKYIKGGAYNFKGNVLTSRNYTDSQLSFRISDHFPLWAEFEI